MVIVIVIVLGLITGSFLNVVIFRLHSGKSFLFRRRAFSSGRNSDRASASELARSQCLTCGRQLQALDLIPLLSFLFLRGKCRYCGKKISWQYPIVELATAITFGLLVQNFQFSIFNFQFWFQAIIASFLIVIAVYDYKHYLILDKVILPASLTALIYQIWQGNLAWALLGALIIAGFFSLQYFASKGRWIGFGDVKLGIFLGLIFAQNALGFLVFAYVVGAVVALLLMAFGGKGLKSRVPFGTILGFSAIIFLLWGDRLVQWYLRLLGI
ncbi:MAG: prepilin peptidase [Candidatus Doudnabacteria bacterium]|nr:prepilin peptidase [Candidatus Doudnabacteria bacterium]